MAVQEGEIHRYTWGMGFIAGLSSWAGSGLGLAKPALSPRCWVPFEHAVFPVQMRA